MLIITHHIFFVFFFSIHQNLLVCCLKTEIKLYVNNVPSLLRCEKNGPLFYFDHFPNNEQFQQISKGMKAPCDLALSSIDQRAIIEIEKLELLCEILHKTEHANEFLYFSSKCSLDSCRKFLPSSTTIINEYNKGNINMERIDLIIHFDSSTQLIIGQLTSDKNLKKIRSKKNGEIRTNQIVFQYAGNIYVNMMCESTNGVCQQYFWNQSSISKTDWSWICYYYPSDTEDPLDHTMISRAVQEFERNNPERKPILKFQGNLDNSSFALNGTVTDLSKTSTSILLILFVSITICGICYCCKKKSKNELTKNINRSSEDSQYSQESLDEVFIE